MIRLVVMLIPTPGRAVMAVPGVGFVYGLRCPNLPTRFPAFASSAGKFGEAFVNYGAVEKWSVRSIFGARARRARKTTRAD